MLGGCEDSEENSSDSISPEVLILSPASGDTVNEIVDVRCLATDAAGIEQTELWVDGESTGVSDVSEPYQLAWNCIRDTQVYEAVLTVRAVDVNGNTSDSSPVYVTVDNNLAVPAPVEIQEIVFTALGYDISWGQSQSSDFGTYTLQKSLVGDFTFSQDLYITSDRNDTRFTDTLVEPTIESHYRVVVSDTLGLSSVGSIASFIDPPPQSVSIDTITFDQDAMHVTWNASNETDFNCYTILYSDEFEGDRDTLWQYFDIETTQHTLTDFNPTVENWFWVCVSDTLGQTTVGNGAVNSLADWALAFDGVDDLIEVSASDGIVLGSDFVVEVWFRSENTLPQTIIEKNSSDTGYSFYVSQSQNPNYVCGINTRLSNVNGFTDRAICDGNWHCVSFVYLGGGSNELWIDGNREYHSGYGGNASDFSQGLLRIGGSDQGWLQGEIYGVKLSSGSEGAIDYDPATMAFTINESTVALWDCEDGPGDTLVDKVSGFEGRILGAEWVWILRD